MRPLPLPRAWTTGDGMDALQNQESPAGFLPALQRFRLKPLAS